MSKWSGSAKPLKWIGLGFGIYGPLAGGVALAALVYGLITRHFTAPTVVLMAVTLLHCVLFTGIGMWARAMYRHVTGLKPAEGVCASLGISEQALQQIAAERRIKPRLILNEEPYYDPADFTDALSLLRASAMPQSAPDTLLRPTSSSVQTAPDELLRSANTLKQSQGNEAEPRL